MQKENLIGFGVVALAIVGSRFILARETIRPR